MNANFRQSFLINLLSSSSGTALRFLVFVLLARLLPPHELGVYAIAAVLLGIAHVLRDLGVSAWLQREADLTPQKVSAALGLLCCSGALLALLLAAGSGAIAQRLGQPELAALLPLLALGLALMPFNTVVAALLQRDFAATELAAVARVGSAAQGLTALGLAWGGWGAMSLAWAQLANVLVCGATCWLLRPQGWQWRPAFTAWGPMLRFGRGALFSNLLQAFNNALPELLLARLGSAQQVGLLGRAQATVNLLGAVAGSALGFGSLRYFAQAHAQRTLALLLARATSLLTGLAWPLLALTALFAEEIVLLLFGPPWLDSVPAVLPLALLAALGLSFNFSAAALAAIGRPGLVAWPVAVTALARIALALLFFDGSVQGFALILLAAAFLALPLQLALQTRALGLPVRAFRRALGPSAVVTGACLAAALVHPLLALPAWYAAVRLTAHPLVTEIQALCLSSRRFMTIRK